MIPTTYGGINKSRTGDSHSKNPQHKEPERSAKLTKITMSVNRYACPFLFMVRSEISAFQMSSTD
jgi:hypothetical protein